MSIQSARRQAELLVGELNVGEAPVNVEAIASHLGLRVLSMKLDENISGLLITKPDLACIVIQESDSLPRKRFSIAHEIGHYFLQHQFEPGEHVHVDRGHLISRRDKKSSDGTDIKEVEANQFAASLLMPSELIRRSIDALNVIDLYDEHVTKLAKTFKVSEQAMTIRLTTLGFLS